MPRRTRPTTAALLGLGLVGLTACGSSDSAAPPAPAPGTIALTASDTACTLSSTELPAGTTTFAITNQGSSVTEVYVYGEADRIITEKENIGPGISYDLTVQLQPGAYEVACKPGMQGNGIRTPVTVIATGAVAPTDAPAQQAVDTYRAYVQEQADALVPLVTRFASTVKAGDVEAAKAQYAPSRIPWERVEPVAESFGDLDPAVDLREADLEPGQEWTGWHRIEKALWVEGSTAGMEPVADKLVADVTDLQARVATAEMSAASIGNGAKELLDEVATGKITGEEEAFSHTDLVDFQANVEGSRKAFEALEPIVATNDPQLVATLEQEFADVEAALAPYRQGDTFVSYETVDEAGRRELARVVDALSEPLSQLTAAAVA